MTLEQRIQRLEDTEAVRALKARYCDLCDDGYDADALCALFVENAVWDGGEHGLFEGRDAIRRFFTRMPKVLSLAIHHVTNANISIDEDGRHATGRWYLLQAATASAGNRAIWLAARYEDRFVRVDESWYFEHVALSSRFVTHHQTGWAEDPAAKIVP